MTQVGRPPKLEEPAPRRTVYLSDGDKAQAENLGNGNISAGIRKALEWAKERLSK